MSLNLTVSQYCIKVITMKERAKNNRTTYLTEDEIAILKKRLLTKEAFNGKCINTTIHADIFEIAPLLPESSVDLLFIDPPYNMNKNFGGNRFRAQTANGYEKTFENWILAIRHTLKLTASMYVCCDWKSSQQIFAVLDRHFKIRNRITWEREKGRGALGNWKNCAEDMWFATVSDNYTFNVHAVKLQRKVIAPYTVNGKPKDWTENGNGKFRLTHPSNFWTDITIPFWSMPENTDHPTQKPEKLVAKAILASSNEGDVVLDPFVGSGTTSVTAKKLKRKFIGIEMSEEYCCLTEKRLAMAERDSAIQGYADGVFRERNSPAPIAELMKSGSLRR